MATSDVDSRGGGITRDGARPVFQFPSTVSWTVADEATSIRLSRSRLTTLGPEDPNLMRQVTELAALQCTQAEAAAVIGVSRETFNRLLSRFPAIRDLWDAGTLSGRASLRRIQFRAALRGNVRLLIWLGRKYLGQTDKPARAGKSKIIDPASDGLVQTGEFLDRIAQYWDHRAIDPERREGSGPTHASAAGARGSRPSRRARKLRPEDAEQVRQIRELGSLQCTQAEAAAVLGVSREEFNRYLSRNPEIREAWEAGILKGRVMLREAQFRVALAGSVPMLMWLGKNYLGQSDHPERKPDSTPAMDQTHSQCAPGGTAGFPEHRDMGGGPGPAPF